MSCLRWSSLALLLAVSPAFGVVVSTTQKGASDFAIDFDPQVDPVVDQAFTFKFTTTNPLSPGEGITVTLLDANGAEVGTGTYTNTGETDILGCSCVEIAPDSFTQTFTAVLEATGGSVEVEEISSEVRGSEARFKGDGSLYFYNPIPPSGDNFTEFVASMPDNAFVQIPNTALIDAIDPISFTDPYKGVIGPQAIIKAWNGAVWIESLQRLEFIALGGHADYCGNEYMSFDLDGMRWLKIRGPSSLDGYDVQTGTRASDGAVGILEDDTPASTHRYDMMFWSESRNKSYLFGGSICSGAGKSNNDWWSVTTNGQYTYLYEDPAYPFLGGTVLEDPITNKVYKFRASNIWEYDLEAITKRTINSSNITQGGGIGTTMRLDKDRRTVYAMGQRGSYTFDMVTESIAPVTPTGDFTLLARYGPGMVFSEKWDRFFAYDWDDTVYVINPTSFQIDTITLSGSNVPKAIKNGVWGRFAYSEKHDAFIVVGPYDEDVYAFKISGLPSTTPTIGTLHWTDPQTYIDAATTGDTVVIPAGVYLHGLNINKGITVELDGVSLWGIHGGKAIIVAGNTTDPIVINDATLDGRPPMAHYENHALIKAEGTDFDITINRLNGTRTVMGVSSDNKGGDLTINDSTITDMGNADFPSNLSHMVYAGEIDTFTVTNSTFRRSHALGHLFKSRAPVTTLTNVNLYGDSSRHSRGIDTPCGGTLNLDTVVIVQSPNADNSELLGLGLENCGLGVPVIVNMADTSITGTRSDARLFRDRSITTWNDLGGNTFTGVSAPSWTP